MTEINAYNIVLRAAGLSRIAALDTYDPDVAEIENHINDAKRELLSNGYKFNTDKVTLSLDQDSKIDVSEYLKVHLPVSTDYNRLVVRSGYLWDPENNEYWDEAITDAWVVSDLDWDDLPSEFQNAVAYRAAATFVEQVKGAVAELPILQQRAYDYLCQAEMSYPNDYGVANGIVKLLASYNR